VELLQTLPREIAEAIAPTLTSVSLEPEAVLFAEGDPADAMYLVVTGRLAASRSDRTAPTADLSAGSTAGTVSLVLGGARSATLTAKEPSTLLSFGRDAYAEVVDRHPQLREALLSLAVDRLSHAGLLRALRVRFPATPPEVVAALAKRCELSEYARGETVFRHGDSADCCYIVLTGGLFVVDDNPEQPSVIAALGPGELFGELSLLLDSPRTAHVVASRAARVASISRIDFETHLLGDNANLLELSRLLGRRLAGDSRAGRSTTRTIAILPLGSPAGLADFATGLRESLLRFGSTTIVDYEAASTRGVSEAAGKLLDSWLDILREEFDVSLFIADAEKSVWTQHLLGAADLIILVADDDSPLTAPLDERATGAFRGPWEPRRWLVRLHASDVALPTPSRPWLESLEPDLHLNVRCGEHAHYQRLARFIRGRAVGLAMSGGAAHGFAHFGTVIALQEFGIPVDFLAGASAGSLAAVLIAQEETDLRAQSGERVERLTQQGNPFTDFTLPVIAVLRSQRIRLALQRVFGDLRIEDVWLPVRAAVTNLSRGVLQSHGRGEAWRITLAGGSPPGLTVPVVIDGDVCGDGGILDNMPLTLLDPVCGVRFASIVSAGSEISMDRDEFPGPLRRLWEAVFGRRGRAPVPHIAQILMASAAISGSRSMVEAARVADLCFEPDLQRYGAIAFESHADIVEAAHVHASERLAASERAAEIRDWIRGSSKQGGAPAC
jgi:predicted acylesterase/phospholipase RssA/CRP-like cAMP-binding protein